ncbi:hypothetical protein B0O80DRAFT_490142, partial [Mortierella sp. GBAus27b]
HFLHRNHHPLNSNNDVWFRHLVSKSESLADPNPRSRQCLPWQCSKRNRPTVALVFCHDTEVSLSQLKKAAKNTEDKTTREKVAGIFIAVAELLDAK